LSESRPPRQLIARVSGGRLGMPPAAARTNPWSRISPRCPRGRAPRVGTESARQPPDSRSKPTVLRAGGFQQVTPLLPPERRGARQHASGAGNGTSAGWPGTHEGSRKTTAAAHFRRLSVACPTCRLSVGGRLDLPSAAKGLSLDIEAGCVPHLLPRMLIVDAALRPDAGERNWLRHYQAR
jgi:hypothetical protein